MLFDLDGTLVDTVQTRIAAWLHVFDEIGVATERAHVAALIGADGRHVAREVLSAAGRELSEAEAAEIDRRAGEVYGELNTDPRPLPGARDVLLELRERGIACAIATSSRPEQVAASIGALELGFDLPVIDGGQVSRAKPAPDLLLLGARRLGVAASRCGCVGDATWDMRAAVAAGMVPVGVTTGAATAATLRSAGARVVVPSLGELQRLL